MAEQLVTAEQAKDLFGDVIRSVQALIEAEYPDAEYATVVLKIGDNKPRCVIPVFRRGTFSPLHRRACTLQQPA